MSLFTGACDCPSCATCQRLDGNRQESPATLNSLAELKYRLHNCRGSIAAEKRVVAADRAPGSVADSSRVFFDLNELVGDAFSGRNCAATAQAASQQLAFARRHTGPHDFYLLLALGWVVRTGRCERRFAKSHKAQAEELGICQSQQEPDSSSCVSILANYYSETGHSGYAEMLLAQRAARTPDLIHHLRQGSYLLKAHHLRALARRYAVDHLYGQAVATDRKMIALVQRKARHSASAAVFYDYLGSDLQVQGCLSDA